MLKQPVIPEHVRNNVSLAGRFKLALTDALCECMSEHSWRRFAIIHDLADRITNRNRFLRSLSFGDSDYPEHVLSLVQHLYDERPEALTELFDQDSVQDWFRENEEGLLDQWRSDPSALATILTHGLSQVESVGNVIDLKNYTDRIRSALPGDPQQAIGATKDMLEAAMRSILHRRGEQNVDRFDFSSLTTRCFTELGLVAGTSPSTQSERCIRKIASSARAMLEAANELRNLAGTGHGRVVGEEVLISVADANLVASSGLMLVAWLLHHEASSS